MTTADRPLSNLQARLQRIGGGFAIATGAAIPVSTGLTSAMLALALLCAIGSGLYTRHWRALLINPLSLSALALFAWLAIGLGYSSAPQQEAWRMLLKYRDLLYIPLLMPFFLAAGIRRAAILAFIGVNLVVLAASWGDSLWQIVTTGALQVDAEIFHKRITQGLFLAFTAYWLYLHQQQRPAHAWPVAGLILLIGIDLFLLVSGRTGQLIFLALAALALFHHFRWRGALLGLLGGLLLIGLAYSASDLFRERVTETVYDLQHFADSDFTTSTAQRMSFYPNSLALIEQRPWIGHGIGSFAGEYAQQVAGSRYPLTENPHNSFLLFGVEGGLVAILLFCNLLLQQWRQGRKLTPQDYRLLQGLLLLVLLDCILNSFMRDSNEGHFYAYFSALLYAPLLNRNQPPAASSQPDS